jgi:glycosidase
VDRPFWEKWQKAIDDQYPNFLVTGEVATSTPAVLSFFEGGVRRRGVDTRLKSLLDFPLEAAVRRVFAQGQPMNLLAETLAQDFLYLHPERLVVFSGNHDQPRILTAASGDISKAMMAQAFVLTVPRTAHLYYGDEIAMQGGRDPDNRKDFPGGWPNDVVNAFAAEGRTGEAATIFNWTRDLLHFRAEHAALRRGGMVVLLASGDQYAYVRSLKDENVLVVFNRSKETKAIELDVADIGWPEGLKLTSFAGSQPAATVIQGKIAIADPKEVNIYWSRPK